MICRIYGLPNHSVFKAEWDPVAHHVLTTGESFPWEAILSLELKMTIQDHQKATTWKKPNLFFLAFIIDVFCTEFQYPNFGWNWTLLALWCLFIIQHWGILIMQLCFMKYVNSFLESFIFQYSNKNLLLFQLRLGPLSPQWVIGIFVNLFHTSKFGGAILSICCLR